MGDEDKTQYGTQLQKTHSSEIFQFIDHVGEFAKDDTEDKKSLITFLEEKSRFTSRGFDYSVVAILGPQSSGKSTLLNLLFGTKFDEMDALSGRQQTTQGVWMGVSENNGHVILVMDVEGTDGRERGEADVFERRTSLFSLTVTSVLIINMWMNDIGRFHAANMGLLKTIFEMNLQLFKENHQELARTKTLLLFIIRDYINTPIEKLKSTLLADLDKLWKGITKPEHYNESQVTDFFDIDFAWLPHKVLAPDQFVQDVGKLRERFFNRENSQFLLKKDYDKAIPADGFGDFANNIWDVVKNNKDLKIPTQKEALALIRCEDIMNQSYNAFTRELEPLANEVDRGVIVENFGERILKLLDKALKSYDELASRYHAETAARKRSILIERVVSTLHVLFERQVERLRGYAIETFREAASKELQSNQPPAELAKSFSLLVADSERAALAYFRDAVQKSILPQEYCEWNYSAPLEELQASIGSETDRMRKELIQVVMTSAKDDLEVILRVPISRTLQQAPANMWTTIRAHFEATLEAALRSLKPCLEALSPNTFLPPPPSPRITASPGPKASGSAGLRLEPDEAVRRYLDALRTHGFVVVKKCAKEASVHLGRLMQSKFDALFNYDANQLPRRWSRRDDIPAIFKASRRAAESLIDQYALIRLAPEEDQIVFFSPDEKEEGGQTPTGDGPKRQKHVHISQQIRDDDPRIILTHSECVALLEQERTATNQSFKAALQDQETAKAQGMNPVMLATLVILGWNEFMAVLSWVLGPLLIPILLFVLGVGYIIYAGKLGGPTGRLLQGMVTSALGQVWTQIQGLLDLVQKRPGAPSQAREDHVKAD